MGSVWSQVGIFHKIGKEVSVDVDTSQSLYNVGKLIMVSMNHEAWWLQTDKDCKKSSQSYFIAELSLDENNVTGCGRLGRDGRLEPMNISNGMLHISRQTDSTIP